jgi:hypothetical protein
MRFMHNADSVVDNTEKIKLLEKLHSELIYTRAAFSLRGPSSSELQTERNGFPPSAWRAFSKIQGDLLRGGEINECGS